MLKNKQCWHSSNHRQCGLHPVYPVDPSTTCEIAPSATPARALLQREMGQHSQSADASASCVKACNTEYHRSTHSNHVVPYGLEDKVVWESLRPR